MQSNRTDKSDDLYIFLARVAVKYRDRPPTLEPSETVARVAAHLMTVGTYADICELIDLTDNAFLNAVMASAEPGWFTDRAWRYWTNYLTRRTDRPDRILAAASSAVRPAIGGF